MDASTLRLSYFPYIVNWLKDMIIIHDIAVYGAMHPREANLGLENFKINLSLSCWHFHGILGLLFSELGRPLHNIFFMFYQYKMCMISSQTMPKYRYITALFKILGVIGRGQFVQVVIMYDLFGHRKLPYPMQTFSVNGKYISSQ